MKNATIQHGGGLDAAIARHGGQRGDWLDLSTGINPHSWPVPQSSPDSWSRLPDSGAMDALLDAARKYYGVPDTLEIVAAPGAQALIEALPRILPGETATIIAPQAGTYGEHAHCCAKAGRNVRIARMPEGVAVDERLAVIVRPNNPDGGIADADAVAALHDRLAGKDGWLIIDEAFCDTVPETSLIGRKPERVIILRSFGKFFGLAGLRLGFAICESEFAEHLRDWFGPWAVSGPALEIGAKALVDRAWIEGTRRRLRRDSERLAELLERNRFALAGRHDLFLLGRHDKAEEFFKALCNRKILTRPFEHDSSLLRFGLPGGEAEFTRLDEALSCISGQSAR